MRAPLTNPEMLLRAAFAGILILTVGSPAIAQQPDDKEQYLKLVNSMRQERGKLQSGIVRISGQFSLSQTPEPLAGPLSILAAFDGKTVRFDSREAGWVFDPSSIQVDPKDPSKIVSVVMPGRHPKP